MLLKISRYKGDSDSCIRYAAEEYLRFNGLEPSGDIGIARSDCKPYLTNLPYYVSFSHTKGLKACAVSEKPVGVDVERMSLKRDFAALSGRFFAKGEKTGKRYRFYKLWTAKEAIKKLKDIPLVDALRASDYRYVRHFDFINGVALSAAGEGSFFIVLFFD